MALDTAAEDDRFHGNAQQLRVLPKDVSELELEDAPQR